MSKLSQRVAYGETLVELGEKNRDIVALEADLGKSTMSYLFQEKFPSRYYEMGIAEQNMTSTAAGLALTGKIPFISTFAVFAHGRAFDQIRQTISIGKLNVKICGSSSGLSDFGDGSTHQCIEDIATMRVIPNMSVFSPVDAVETKQIVRAMANNQGPMYIRLNRNDLPIITEENGEYIIGEPRVVRPGNDVVVFATGIMVHKALEAAEVLKDNLSVKVVNISTIKPMNETAIINLTKGCKAIVTAEEHSVIGGLGSAISEVLRKESLSIDFVGVRDSFGTSAEDYDILMNQYGLTSENIVKTIKDLVYKNIKE